jgi:hypothetical protein
MLGQTAMQFCRHSGPVGMPTGLRYLLTYSHRGFETVKNKFGTELPTSHRARGGQFNFDQPEILLCTDVLQYSCTRADRSATLGQRG